MSGIAPLKLEPQTTLSEAVRAVASVLRAANFGSCERDARFLVQGMSGTTAEELITHPSRPLGDAAQRLQLAIARRLKHEPVSRILGWREFYGRRFEVTPDVLDPRPESETLITAALELADANSWRNQSITIADIGTGSGILIATLLSELPTATGVASDMSAPALNVAKRNSEALGIGESRLCFLHTRGLEKCQMPIDVIVSNPPYIPSVAIKTLAPEVQNFDPLLALDGGEDGLVMYREIAAEIAARHHPRTLTILVEIGAGQGHDITQIFLAAGCCQIKVWRDLAGLVRVLGFERKNAKIGDL